MTTSTVARVIAWAEARRMRVEVCFATGRIVLTGTLWADGSADMTNPERREFSNEYDAMEWQRRFSETFGLREP